MWSSLGYILTFFLHYFCALTDPIAARASCHQYGETWAHQEPSGACSSVHSQAYHQKEAVPSSNCPSTKYDRTHYLWPPLMAEAAGKPGRCPHCCAEGWSSGRWTVAFKLAESRMLWYLMHLFALQSHHCKGGEVCGGVAYNSSCRHTVPVSPGHLSLDARCFQVLSTNSRFEV